MRRKTSAFACCTGGSGKDEIVSWLSDHGVEAAVMEATGVYWRAIMAPPTISASRQTAMSATVSLFAKA